MRRGSVLKLRFPDPGFDRLWSDRRQRVSSTHRTPSRSPLKPRHANISFPKSILQSTVCPMRAVPTAGPLEIFLRRYRDREAPSRTFAELWPLTCKRFRGYSWLNTTRPNGSRNPGWTQVIAGDVEIRC